MTRTGRTAGAALVEALAARGVRRFYTVPGESFLEVLDAVEATPGLQLVSTRHESGAAFMAEAEGKLTRAPAAVMATRAVGAANLSIGVATAREDSTPMLVLLGQVESDSLGRGDFQEADLPAFLGQFAVHGETLQVPSRAAEVAARAHRAATTGRGGPAVVALPADVLGAGCAVDGPAVTVSAVASVEPAPEVAAAVAALLRAAVRPVAVLGSGAQAARPEVRALVEAFGLGVYTAFRRQDALDNTHPAYLGHLTLGTAPELLGALREADVVLALGTRLGATTTQGWTLPAAGARVVHVDVEPAAMTAPVDVEWSVAADVAGFCRALLRLGRDEPERDAPHRDWSAEHATYLRLSTPPDVTGSAAGVHPAAVVAAMARHLPGDLVLTNDAGNFSVFGHRYWRFTGTGRQLGPVNGAMGYGVPAAVGASLAAPGRPVAALAGDGGFLMTGVELETAVRVGAPVLAVVLANRSYGTIALHQARRFGRLAGTDIGPVDLAGFARSLGAEALDVTDAGQLDDAFAAAAAFDVPRVIVVRTDPDVLTPDVRLGPLLARADRLTSRS